MVLKYFTLEKLVRTHATLFTIKWLHT